MKDTVFLQGMEIECMIGVHPQERTTARPLRLDLELACDCSAAGASDDLAAALDYEAVAATVRRVVETSSFRLVEALAESVASAVLAAHPGADEVRVRIAKPGAVVAVEAAGVEITRRRAERCR